MMGRPRQATADQVAEIWRLHAEEHLGTLRIAKRLGLRRGLVWRVLHRVRPVQALPGGSPQSALPPERARVAGALPRPGEAGAAFGACRWCKSKHVAILAGGLCQQCVSKECQLHGSRPLFFGSCWRCAADRPIHLRTAGADYPEGLCGLHKNAELASAIAQSRHSHRQPEVDSRGVYWDPDWRGGSWRVG